MRTTILIFVAILFAGCEYEKIDYPGEITDGFCIVTGDDVILTHHDIEYYDYSAHLIYLKDSKSLEENIKSLNAFKVFANKQQVYTGQVLPHYSSTMGEGPTIRTFPSLYGNYIIAISFIGIQDQSGNITPDPRNDEKIEKALKKYGQFHAGLSCEITSIEYLNPQNVTVKLKLKNNDSFNFYYLDPDKMGIGLFHYFTNGLTIRNTIDLKYCTHKIEVVKPEPWNSWKKEWLSIIKSNETKDITLTYNNFEVMPTGHYKATFRFPGLHYQVKKDEINQGNGNIWLGEIFMSTDIEIP